MKKIVPFLAIVMAFLISFVSFQNAHAAETGYIWVDAERDQIMGSGWMTGANILVAIGDDEFNIAASEAGSFFLDFYDTGYDIEVGQTIIATHAGNSVTHVVQPSLSFDFTQEEFLTQEWQGERLEVITGTAPADSKVVIWISQMGQQGRVFEEVSEVQVNGAGEWSMMLLNPDPKPFEYKDVHAFLFYDSEGNTLDLNTIKGGETEWGDVVWNANATFARRVSDPGSFILAAYPQINTIWGHEWPYGELDITVTRGSQTFTYNHGIHTGGDFRIHYDDHGINLKMGDTVTATIGTLSMSHEVIDLAITSIDTANNKISGTANPGESVYVQLGAEYGTFDNMRSIQADSSGIWVADFSVVQSSPWGGEQPVVDITSETKFWAYQNTSVISTRNPYSEGRTIITNQVNLIELVRSFIVTRMAEFAALKTNISAVLDDPSQKLIFESPDFGKVEFSSFDIDTLLVINPEFLENMGNFVNISYNSEDGTLRTKVDTTALEFLAGHEAVIYFFNVAEKLGFTGELTAENVRDYIDIKVYDNGELVTDLSKYFNWDEVTYNSETDVLTLPVNHFTEYVLGESSELPETGGAIAGIVSLGLVSLTTYAILKKKKILS